MARFRLQKRFVKRPELIIQVGRQASETLAGTRFYNCADDQGIDQFSRLAGAHRLAQFRGVTRSADLSVGDIAPLHQREHLLEVPQLLSREARHLVQQFEIVYIAIHQIEGRARRFFLAVGVVDQQQFWLGERLRHPGVGCGTQ